MIRIDHRPLNSIEKLSNRVEILESQTELELSRWYRWLILCVIFFVAGHYAHCDTAPQPKPAPDIQTVEQVYPKRCKVDITPASDFALHIPMKDNGEPDNLHIYFTGKLIFNIVNPKCGEVEIHRLKK